MRKKLVEDFMNSDSTGGTVIKGRGLNNTKTKILGFNIEPEKDICT